MVDNPSTEGPDGQAHELGSRDWASMTAAALSLHGGIQFATAVEAAHELRNLLTVLLGSLEPLHRQPLDERGRRQLARAEQSARQLWELLSRCPPASDPLLRWQPHEVD